MFGVLNIDKPQGFTSHDVVAVVRRTLGIKKVGHAGTLDPQATGVLPVCIGEATRLIEFLPDDKRYRAEITLGKTTHTWDSEGDVLSQDGVGSLNQHALEAALGHYVGVIQQIVPPHSAVHVNGKKLYEYARKGIAVELPVREATIHSIELLDFYRTDNSLAVVCLDVHCASGTYIRSLAYELGQRLGTGAYLSALVRTGHGQFNLADSVQLEEFRQSAHPQIYLQNPAAYITMPHYPLSEELVTKISHGLKLNVRELPTPVKHKVKYLITYQDYPAAVAIAESSGRLRPVKVFQAILDTTLVPHVASELLSS